MHIGQWQFHVADMVICEGELIDLCIGIAFTNQTNFSLTRDDETEEKNDLENYMDFLSILKVETPEYVETGRS